MTELLVPTYTTGDSIQPRYLCQTGAVVLRAFPATRTLRYLPSLQRRLVSAFPRTGPAPNITAVEQFVPPRWARFYTITVVRHDALLGPPEVSWLLVRNCCPLRAPIPTTWRYGACNTVPQPIFPHGTIYLPIMMGSPA